MLEKYLPNHSEPARSYTDLVLNTFKFHGLLLSAGDRLVEDLGITSALWQVLGSILFGPLPMAQIARDMGLTRQSVRRNVQILKQRGLVEYHDNPNHKRAMLIAMTPQGEEVLARANALQKNWAESISQALSPEDMNHAVEVIKTLSVRLEDQEK